MLYPTPLLGQAQGHQSAHGQHSCGLGHVKAVAQQLKTTGAWTLLLRYVRKTIVLSVGPFTLSAGVQETG